MVCVCGCEGEFWAWRLYNPPEWDGKGGLEKAVGGGDGWAREAVGGGRGEGEAWAEAS